MDFVGEYCTAMASCVEAKADRENGSDLMIVEW